MLKDADDRLLCPHCGGKLMVEVRLDFYGPAHYDARADDLLDFGTATKGMPIETAYLDLWCTGCVWNTEQVHKFLAGVRDDSE